ncbi:I78 family peptidase inhibitor [Pollutimonas harenae]|uniref:Peptidase inhibitor I78 family protein n=1 Tax=Pollutimonas harenae TaxID=657015 RepID=A0A853H1J8_9BURK|nr:I78 family peptidase inhibitor [Pollutimonas harenae]NYT86172.1 hypothetical protein [Pollutimonas harenae]TEA71207.1 hypothetical protein ERD84_11260 [Pollutimonas harenae]
MLIRTVSIFATTLALSACSSVDLGEPAQDTKPGACNADQASHVVGKHISPEQEQEALRSSGASTLRVIKPGQAITRDYRVDRLNLQLNDYDTVVRAYCG